ncbi:MAG: glycosyl hydrolase family 8 [Actinomycetota bacterium]|nr:glycosyl hydrolase family 8 [Actinomycetota bacterium]
MVTSTRAPRRYGYATDVAPHRNAVGWRKAMRSDMPLIVVLTVIAFAAHAINAFQFPAFHEDEGIYSAQAWSVLRDLRLSPYTYTYDHAPGGWIFAALWMFVTGGPETFGGSVLSGRVFVLLLHAASVPMLYRLARKLGCGALAATIATLLFSLSPLAVNYQRMFLLDNIMVFWLLLSINLLLDGWGRLSRLVLSGVCFGIAVLTKETALFLLPAIAFIALQQRWDHQGRFAVSGWLIPAISVISLYPLYAALKGELFPAGTGFGSAVIADPNVSTSLLDALKWQAERGGGSSGASNEIGRTVAHWLTRDAALVVAGVAAVVVNLIRGLRDRRMLAAGLLGLFPLLYLARGGILFDFYILFAIPFLALNIGVLLSRVPRAPVVALVAVFIAVSAGFSLMTWGDPGYARALFEQAPASVNQRALAWIKGNVPPSSYIITRDDFWADLHEEGFEGPSFPNVHSHWKVAADPAVRESIFHDDWSRVDYLIMTPNLKSAFEATDNEVALDALAHSSLVRVWSEADYRVELHKVNKISALEEALLNDSYAYLEERFERGGAFVDDDGVVTSEAQAYGLLRAAWSDERADFERIWGWTAANLQRDDGLLAWKWERGAVADESSAADADTDAALALLFAGKRWDEPALIDEGTRIAGAIWQEEVVTVGGIPYLTAGDWAPARDTLVVNPSYLAPYAYRIFARVDSAHDWYGLIDSSYELLFSASADPLDASSSAGLPPDWVGLDPTTGELVAVDISGQGSTNHGYDAGRTWWRIAVDLKWSRDGRAGAFLEQAGFLRDEVERKESVSAVYAHDGRVVEEPPSMVVIAGAIAALHSSDPDKANELYARYVAGGARRAVPGAIGPSEDDIYAQEWAWFAIAFYGDHLVDLWHVPPSGW